VPQDKIVQWSPEQISNWLKINNYEGVSHTWIYQHIEKDKSEGGELSDNLRRGTYTKGHKPCKGNIVDRVSIEERPAIVNERKRLGDYEIDLIWTFDKLLSLPKNEIGRN
jgi:IS30 family transposase